MRITLLHLKIFCLASLGLLFQEAAGQSDSVSSRLQVFLFYQNYSKEVTISAAATFPYTNLLSVDVSVSNNLPFPLTISSDDISLLDKNLKACRRVNASQASEIATAFSDLNYRSMCEFFELIALKESGITPHNTSRGIVFFSVRREDIPLRLIVRCGKYYANFALTDDPDGFIPDPH